MKIAPAFSTGPLWQFASHKSVFFCFFAASLSPPSQGSYLDKRLIYQ